MTYRDRLPQLDGGVFLTDGGIETSLIYHHGLDLPEFAAFDLLKDEAGAAELRKYYEPYIELAASRRLGFILESPTWRANPKWAEKIGYTSAPLRDLNGRAIALMEELRKAHPNDAPVVISGCVGPHDDGYNPGVLLDADAAHEYHSEQIDTFKDTVADMVTAITMTYTNEALGVTRAALDAHMPVAISFTVETDGRLPSGQGLGDAIEEVDAATNGAPAYFMINCAHPEHFSKVLDPDEPWTRRIRGLRANASQMSHAELDEATELDAGDPVDLAARYVELKAKLPELNVLGGCCGTDHRHVTQMCETWPAA